MKRSKKRPGRARIVTDPVTGFPVLRSGKGAPMLRSEELEELLNKEDKEPAMKITNACEQRKRQAIQAAAKHEFPAGDIDVILTEIESRYQPKH